MQNPLRATLGAQAQQVVRRDGGVHTRSGLYPPSCRGTARLRPNPMGDSLFRRDCTVGMIGTYRCGYAHSTPTAPRIRNRLSRGHRGFCKSLETQE